MGNRGARNQAAYDPYLNQYGQGYGYQQQGGLGAYRGPAYTITTPPSYVQEPWAVTQWTEYYVPTVRGRQKRPVIYVAAPLPAANPCGGFGGGLGGFGGGLGGLGGGLGGFGGGLGGLGGGFGGGGFGGGGLGGLQALPMMTVGYGGGIPGIPGGFGGLGGYGGGLGGLGGGGLGGLGGGGLGGLGGGGLGGLGGGLGGLGGGGLGGGLPLY